jgi:CRISPR-associated protein Cas1
MRHLLNTLYVTNPDAYVCVNNENVCVRLEGKDVLCVPFHLLDSIVLFGHVSCSVPMLGICAQRGVRTVLLDERGRFAARVEGPISGNVLLRQDQYRMADNAESSLKLSRRFIVAKVANSRRVLMRQQRDHKELKPKLKGAIGDLQASVDDALRADDLGQLRGLEGDAARTYFSVFRYLIRSEESGMNFNGRTRRPPKDPANAALSFFYVMLTKDVATACECVGLDPQKGFLHQVRPGRESLALDLVEEFRAPLVDRFVLSLVNNKRLVASDFYSDAEGAVFFTDEALRNALDAWQRQKQREVVHPYLQEKIQIGLLPFVQAQLCARYIRGQLDDYPAFLWR